jgi:hypothetical protein
MPQALLTLLIEAKNEHISIANNRLDYLCSNKYYIELIICTTGLGKAGDEEILM